jgi:hypothetical protein
MALLDRVKVPEAPPRGVDPERVDRVLAAIPKKNLRDRVLVTLIARTVLLDDEALVALLRRYLRVIGYTRGPLFRAAKNFAGGPLRYASAQELWAKYNGCGSAGGTV